MIKLERKDWAEIYNALLSKSTSATCAGDTKWINHLKRIMNKIGPDGERAVKRGVSKQDDWWTITLLYPDSVANNYGQDTYRAVMRGFNLVTAVEKARAKCMRLNKFCDMDPDDLFVISVIKGAHKDHVARWDNHQQRKQDEAKQKTHAAGS